MNKKGISSVVFTLLLVAVAVAASVLISWWVEGMTGAQYLQHTSTINVKGIQPIPHNSNSKYLLTLSNNTLRVVWMTESVLEKIVLNRNIQIVYYYDRVGNFWIASVEK
jgi:hypothetical protein